MTAKWYYFQFGTPRNVIYHGVIRRHTKIFAMRDVRANLSAPAFAGFEFHELVSQMRQLDDSETRPITGSHGYLVYRAQQNIDSMYMEDLTTKEAYLDTFTGEYRTDGETA
jgi:hypothetical protein